MNVFQYLKPARLEEAVALLAAHPEARPLSGGMSLLPMMKQSLAAPSHLVDLTRLPELAGIRMQDDRLWIGAATCHADVASSAMVRTHLPALATLAGVIADPQVRNRGTIGGSVANNDPAADYPAAVLALDARVHTTERVIDADDFFRGMFETALGAGEIVTGIEFPCPQRAAYVKYRHPASGYALVGVFVADTANGVRLAVTGAAPCVFRWLDAEAALTQGCDPAALEGLQLDPQEMQDDPQDSPAWRAHLVTVIARRAVAQVCSRARH